jgi:hypothetical protein
VYDYDEWVDNKKTGQREDPKKRLLNRFHQQRSELRKEINSALVEVELPKTDLLRKKQNSGTSFWGIADTTQFEDLACVQECRIRLSGTKTVQADEGVKGACERLGATIGNPLALLTVDQTHEPWIGTMVKDVLRTYRNALNYLATQAHTEAEQASDEEAQQTLQWKEAHYWTTYALWCARTAGAFFEDQRTLLSNGETALQKALFRCVRLSDPERATSIYQEFKDVVENGGEIWEPQEKTKAYWQKVLTLGDAA